MSEQLQQLYLFKIEDGQKVRYRLTVTKDLIWTNTERVGPDHKPTPMVSAEDREALAFFSKHAPCWFAGCEELREQYQKELDALPADCPGCQEGALMRKYIPRIVQAIRAAKDAAAV